MGSSSLDPQGIRGCLCSGLHWTVLTLGILDRKPCHSQSGLHVVRAYPPMKRPRVSSTGRPLSNGPCCAHPGIARLYE